MRSEVANERDRYSINRRLIGVWVIVIGSLEERQNKHRGNDKRHPNLNRNRYRNRDNRSKIQMQRRKKFQKLDNRSEAKRGEKNNLPEE